MEGQRLYLTDEDVDLRKMKTILAIACTRARASKLSTRAIGNDPLMRTLLEMREREQEEDGVAGLTGLFQVCLAGHPISPLYNKTLRGFIFARNSLLLPFCKQVLAS